MTKEVRLRDEVVEDLTDASNWYECQLTGLGHDFLDIVHSSLNIIAENPRQYPEIYREVRRFLLPRFPFSIFYKVEENFILVFGIMHASRNPRKWKDRT